VLRDEELLAVILDPLDDVPVVGLDAQGNIVRWSAGASAALGYAQAEALARHVSSLYSDEDVARGRPAEELEAAAAQGHSVRDRWVRRADGSRFWARSVIRVRKDERGRVTGFVKATLDLSDQAALLRDLAAEDQRYAGLVEIATEGIVSTDEDGRIILFNRGAERMFGYRREEVIGEPLSMLLPERHRQAHDGHLGGFRSGATDSKRMGGAQIVTALARGGVEFPIEASIAKVELGDGAILTAILRDVSERVETERALRESEERARQLADALPFPVIRLDTELRVVLANDAAAAWTSRPKADMLGLELGQLAEQLGNELALEGLLPHMTAALAGERRLYVGRARDGRGQVREMEVVLFPSRGESGVDGCYLVTLDRDSRISREESARHVLTSMGRLLGGMLDEDATIDGAVQLGIMGFADDCVAYMEKEGGAIGRLEARRDSPALELSEIRPTEVPAGLRQIMMEGGISAGTDEEGTYVAVPVACVQRAGGALLFRWAAPYDATHTDVEIARELGRRLASSLDHIELTRRALEAARARDWLLHKVTHDLGNPVASIAMVADRLLRTAVVPEGDGRARRLLEGIKEQSQEMGTLIESLVSTSALRVGRAEVNPRMTDAGAALEAAVSLMQPIAEYRKVRIVPRRPRERTQVLADPSHLRHALTSLLSEQVSWCEAGGQVAAAVVLDGSDVRFEVSGPGPGFVAEKIAQRLDEAVTNPTRTDDEVRLSLSLLIASELVRAHGSRLVVSDGPQLGTLYAFSLPAAR
jgi:PAS domain S-box-containing protein